VAIDCELYLPGHGPGNPARRRAAGIPDGTVFATKPRLATPEGNHDRAYIQPAEHSRGRAEYLDLRAKASCAEP